MKQYPVGLIDPEMPFPVHMAMVSNPAPEFEGKETADSKLSLPWPSMEQGSKILTNIGCRSLHCCSAKHGQSHLNYCIEAESHSRYFSMQPIPLTIRNLPGKNSLDFPHCSTKLAVLISVAHVT